MKLANLIIVLFLFISGAAIAETSSQKHAGHAMNPEMKKQHETMATIVKQWNVCKNAIKENNFKDAELAVETIIEAAVDIDNFRLHKNADKHEHFAQQCNVFRENILKLKDEIKSRDADTANKLSITIEENCNQCHSTFRK